MEVLLHVLFVQYFVANPVARKQNELERLEKFNLQVPTAMQKI